MEIFCPRSREFEPLKVSKNFSDLKISEPCPTKLDRSLKFQDLKKIPRLRAARLLESSAFGATRYHFMSNSHLRVEFRVCTKKKNRQTDKRAVAQCNLRDDRIISTDDDENDAKQSVMMHNYTPYMQRAGTNPGRLSTLTECAPRRGGCSSPLREPVLSPML